MLAGKQAADDLRQRHRIHDPRIDAVGDYPARHDPRHREIALQRRADQDRQSRGPAEKCAGLAHCGRKLRVGRHADPGDHAPATLGTLQRRQQRLVADSGELGAQPLVFLPKPGEHRAFDLAGLQGVPVTKPPFLRAGAVLQPRQTVAKK